MTSGLKICFLETFHPSSKWVYKSKLSKANWINDNLQWLNSLVFTTAAIANKAKITEKCWDLFRLFVKSVTDLRTKRLACGVEQGFKLCSVNRFFSCIYILTVLKWEEKQTRKIIDIIKNYKLYWIQKDVMSIKTSKKHLL